MSIRFVQNLNEEPNHQLIDVGVKILFTTIKGIVQPYEIIEPDGTEISIGIPAIA